MAITIICGNGGADLIFSLVFAQKPERAVLLAPTALNKQAFTLRGEGRSVLMTCDNGVFSGVDLGIGKYHFELGAGRENFDWA